MAEQLPDTNHDLPRVVVAQRVIDKILRGAMLYPEPETGEAMIGLVVPQSGRLEPDFYILDTISPGEHAVRQWGMFEQGSDWQGDVFHWLYVNWEAFRELRRPSYGRALAAKWDVPLMHVGDWHKQPGDMTDPSIGDIETAHRMIDDPETPMLHIVAPIVTLYPLHGRQNVESAAARSHEATPEPTADDAPESGENSEAGPVETAPQATDTPPPVDTQPEPVADPPKDRPAHAIIRTLADEGWLARIDFWYMSKRTRRFTPVALVIWPDERLPNLPPVAWHLLHPRRFDQEYALLTEAGYAVDVVRWDADGKPPYEICFSVYKPGSQHVFVLVTPVDYPAHMPAQRVAPLVSVAEDEDVFEKVYDASEPVLMTDLPDWLWDSKRTLIELVWHIEKVLGEKS